MATDTEIALIRIHAALYDKLVDQIQVYYGKDGCLAALQDGHRSLERELEQAQARVKRLEDEIIVALKVCASVANPNHDEEWDWPGLAQRFRAVLVEEVF